MFFFFFIVHNDLLHQKQTIPSFTDINLSCLVNTALHPCLKKYLPWITQLLSILLLAFSSRVTNIIHMALWIPFMCLLYADLFTNSGRSFRFPGLILCFCCCYCYYFMSHSVHFAKNHTSYVLTVHVLSSFAFHRLLIGYLILSNRGK